MSDPTPLITEDDLHAYVDAQLAPDRRDAVEQHLATHPEAARRVAAWREQRAALRSVFAEAAEPLPERLSLSHILQERRQPRTPLWRIAAGLVLALGIGGSVGWVLHGPSSPPRPIVALQLLEQEALSSHVVYSADRRHPIEVGVADEAHLRQWLSNRLGRVVSPPDLSAMGYHLIGGRLLATERGGAAALFMYDDASGERLSLLVRPMNPDLQAPQTDISRGDVKGCAWIDKGMGYAVVAALPDAQLDSIATHIRGELGTG